MGAYDYIKYDFAGYCSMRSVLPIMCKMADCIMAIRTTLKRRSSTTLLFSGTTCASVTKV